MKSALYVIYALVFVSEQQLVRFKIPYASAFHEVFSIFQWIKHDLKRLKTIAREKDYMIQGRCDTA